MSESALNLTLLVLSVTAPIPTLPGRGVDVASTDLVGPRQLANVALFGTVLVGAFHGHQAEIARSLGR